MQLTIDRAWLLEIIQQRLGDQPDITDWGATAAAVARHSDTVLDKAVYPEPHHTEQALSFTACSGFLRWHIQMRSSRWPWPSAS